MNKNLRLLSVVFLLTTLAATATAAPVTYWFSGFVTAVNNASNAMPFSVNVGAPFTARLSYDPSLVASSNLNSYPEGDTGFYYFTNVDGISILFQIAGHTITNIVHPWRYAGLVGIYDRYNNEDSYWAQITGRLALDGTPYLDDPQFSVISIYLDDDSQTAFDSVALPTKAPALDKLKSHRDMVWGAYIDDGGPTPIFGVSGELTSITTTEQVQLNYRPLATGKAQLGWPVDLSGFTLQTSTNLSSTNWQTVTNSVVDISVEHTVTVSNTVPARFYRLIK